MQDEEQSARRTAEYQARLQQQLNERKMAERKKYAFWCLGRLCSLSLDLCSFWCFPLFGYQDMCWAVSMPIGGAAAAEQLVGIDWPRSLQWL